jgi:hypothetical protein
MGLCESTENIINLNDWDKTEHFKPIKLLTFM